MKRVEGKKLFVSFIGVAAVITVVGITVNLAQTKQSVEQSAAGAPSPVVSLPNGCYYTPGCEHACPATNPSCCAPKLICPSITPVLSKIPPTIPATVPVKRSY